jgi:hypothetical protein
MLGDDESTPPTFQEMRCHMLFYVKMENFQRKTCLVAGGHMTEVSSGTMTYASVVARESVRIASIRNNLEVKTAGIENAYLTAPIGEKIWCTLGPVFGGDAGKCAMIVRALYGIKLAGASFRNHLADCKRHLGWESCKVDHDVLYKPETQKGDGHQYYAYCLLLIQTTKLEITHEIRLCTVLRSTHPVQESVTSTRNTPQQGAVILSKLRFFLVAST